MAQAVSRRPVTGEFRFRARVSPCGVCGEENGTGTGFSPSCSAFPCQYHSTVANHDDHVDRVILRPPTGLLFISQIIYDYRESRRAMMSKGETPDSSTRALLQCFRRSSSSKV
jgi:hypothetical protein